VHKSLAGAFIFAALAAGCGGDGGGRLQPTTTHAMRPSAAAVRPYRRDYKRLGADVRALRAEALKVHGQTLLGTPALRRGTAKFIEDLQQSVLSPKGRNRMIDHAAAAVATSCDQCFQMLEAVRPIPQIAGH
jgi:hypothetical protein